MKKIQYVKLVGLLTILLFLNISCKPKIRKQSQWQSQLQ